MIFRANHAFAQKQQVIFNHLNDKQRIAAHRGSDVEHVEYLQIIIAAFLVSILKDNRLLISSLKV